MNQDDHIQEPDAAPAAEARPGRRRPSLLLLLALLAAVAMLAVAGGVSWRAQGRRVAELEQALAAATAEREAASAGAEQRQAVLDQAEAEREALDARRLELERQLAAAREEVARLQAELAGRETQSVAREETATARAETAAPSEARSDAPAPEPAPSPAATAGTAGPATGTSAVGPPDRASATGERAAGEPGVEAIEERLASAAATDSPAAPESGPAAAGQRAAEAETAAPEPVAGPEPESLTVTFDVNSSYLPASLDGRLRRLAESLEPGRRYEVELTASVGAGPVANAGDAGAAARYNRWLAERRADRVAAFLQENAEAGAEALTIERDFAADDSSRRVVVRVRPVP